MTTEELTEWKKRATPAKSDLIKLVRELEYAHAPRRAIDQLGNIIAKLESWQHQ